MSAPRTVAFEGPCAFLTCLDREPHEHEICPDCGAVRHGNFFCATCRGFWCIDLPIAASDRQRAPREDLIALLIGAETLIPDGDGYGQDVLRRIRDVIAREKRYLGIS